MLRPEFLLYPPFTPAPALPAATLLLLRDRAEGGWEVLMTRRAAAASFAPDMFVFPGGGVEPQDAQPGDEVYLPQSGVKPELQAAVVAALRETWEEMGVLLAVDAKAQPVQPALVQSLDRTQPLWPQLRALGLQLDARSVWQIGHFTAPPHLSKRFTVPFFVARMPHGQVAVPDDREQFEAVWVQPVQALQAHRAQQMPMMLPTVRTLAYLAPLPSAQAVLERAAQGPMWEHAPRFVLEAGKEKSLLEHDAAYAEACMVAPDGQVGHDVAWQNEKPVALRKHVQRLTAPNPGVMTGPGTNSYVVGSRSTGFIVIDPGPADAAHVARLGAATGGEVRHIVCTHSHPDHAPGAALLQAWCESQGKPKPLVYGLPSAPTAAPSSYFVPDVKLDDGMCVAVQGTEGSLQVTHTLQAIFTPGHAANHLCLLLKEDALLFSGDHVLNGSTTIVDTPDGNMRDYIDSLDKLLAVCEQMQVEFLLPAHGHVLGQAAQVIHKLKSHRLAREEKVLQAMRNQPSGSLADWVAQAYADTPENLWPLAQRSLIAHVERIRELGLLDVTD